MTDETLTLLESVYDLTEALRHLRKVDTASINEHKTGDHVADRLATEGMYTGTIQQVRAWHRVAWAKQRRLLV